MAIADGLILAIIACSALLSWVRGFVKVALSLVIWLSAVIISFSFAESLATVLVDYISLAANILFIVARLMLFVGTLIVGSLIKNLAGELIKATGLGKTDRVIGIGFGVLRGGVIVLVLIAVLRYFDAVQNQFWWQESQIIPVLSEFEAQLMAWFRQQPEVNSALPTEMF